MHQRASAAVVARSTLFAVCLAAVTVVWALVSLASAVLPYRTRYAIISRWSAMVRWLLRVVVGLDYRIEGEHNIPATPCIVLSRHESAWETIIFTLHFRPQTWVLKRELLWLPFFGWGLALLRPIAIDRSAGKTALQQVVEQGRQRLADGAWVVVFPEGTRLAPGVRRRYKLGGASLAAATGAAVLPIALDSGDYWGRNRFLKYPGTVRVVIGQPIDTRGLSAGEINRRAEAWLDDAMTRLRPRRAAAAQACLPGGEALK